MTVVAWLGLVAGFTWLIMFVQIARNELNERPTTQGYRAICMVAMVITIFASYVTNLGVIT